MGGGVHGVLGGGLDIGALLQDEVCVSNLLTQPGLFWAMRPQGFPPAPLHLPQKSLVSSRPACCVRILTEQVRKDIHIYLKLMESN